MSISKETFTNALETTLDGAINNSVTTVVLTDASTFPLTFFRIKVEDEIMFVTSRSGNTLTVIRGYESTTAASHVDDSFVNHTVTVGSLQRFRQQLLADAGITDFTDSASADDDDFDDENFSGWTTVQGSPSSTMTERSHRASLLIPGGSANAQHYGFVKAKVPTGGKFIQLGMNIGGHSGQYPIAGLVFSDGATYGAGRQVQFSFSVNENQFFLRETTNWNNNIGQSGSGGVAPFVLKVMHMRMTWNSSNNYLCEVSPDGISWSSIFNGSYGSLGTPSHAGFIATNWGSSNSHIHSFTYWRANW